MGVVRFAVRQGAVFRGRFWRGDLSLPTAHAWLAGSRPKLLRAEHDVDSRWPSPGVGLGQWFSGRTRLERLPVFAALVELFTRWPSPAKPRTSTEQAPRQSSGMAECSSG